MNNNILHIITEKDGVIMTVYVYSITPSLHASCLIISCVHVMSCAQNGIYRVAQKSKPQTFVHIFAKCWSIFTTFFNWRILWKICNKVAIKHTNTS